MRSASMGDAPDEGSMGRRRLRLLYTRGEEFRLPAWRMTGGLWPRMGDGRQRVNPSGVLPGLANREEKEQQPGAPSTLACRT